MEMAKAASEASSKSTPRSKITMVRHEGTNTPRSLLDEENQNPNSTPQMKRIISSRRSNSIGTDSDASVSIQRARKIEISLRRLIIIFALIRPNFNLKDHDLITI